LRPDRRRELVDDVRSTWQVSIRRACSVLRAERSSYHYRGKGADQADLKQRIKEIAETRVRYGYRRIHVLLQREGWAINGKRVYRLYREMGLQLRKKSPKRRVKAKLREGRCAASRVNDVWAMDFVHDQLATGPKLRILTVVDTFSRFSPAVEPRFRFRAPDVINVLERVCAEVGYPTSIRVDQGSEFISRELDLWAYMKGVTLDFSRPGKPTDTDVVEKPFHPGAGIFFFERDLARGLVRHRAVKSAFSTRTRSAARFSGVNRHAMLTPFGADRPAKLTP
jgi:putative transposase